MKDKPTHPRGAPTRPRQPVRADGARLGQTGRSVEAGEKRKGHRHGETLAGASAAVWLTAERTIFSVLEIVYL